ncbi:MurR/RpiR family transcriptional regulator, partial [Lachnotalea glycerini]
LKEYSHLNCIAVVDAVLECIEKTSKIDLKPANQPELIFSEYKL